MREKTATSAQVEGRVMPVSESSQTPHCARRRSWRAVTQRESRSPAAIAIETRGSLGHFLLDHCTVEVHDLPLAIHGKPTLSEHLQHAGATDLHPRMLQDVHRRLMDLADLVSG